MHTPKATGHPIRPPGDPKVPPGDPPGHAKARQETPQDPPRDPQGQPKAPQGSLLSLILASFWPHFGSLDGSLDGCLIFHCFLMLFGSLFEPILAPFSIPKLIISVIKVCMFFYCFSTPFFFNFTSIFQGDSHRHSSPNRNNSLRDFERLHETLIFKNQGYQKSFKHLRKSVRISTRNN